MRKEFSGSDPKVRLAWIATLRIMMGVMFLTTWVANLVQGFYTPDGLLDFFAHIFPQAQNPLAWYAAFINNVILPIRTFFAPFQMVTEFALGLALLVGALTPFFSLAGIFFLINTFLATFGHDWPWAYLMPIGILTVTLFTRAGRALGVDAWLLNRYGERRFWW
jgi:uncharacterized membrane protein YphA (DoxX/SURF4 family)